jgi:hypothetical protein
MPSFFFDTSDGDRFIRDDIGLKMESLQAARDEAMAALPGIMLDKVLDGDLREVFAIIRDADGRMRCKARLTISCEWSD